MKYPVGRIFLFIFLALHITSAEIRSQTGVRIKPVTRNSTAKPDKQSGSLRICQGVPIPTGYIIVAYETSSSCSNGAYVLKRDDSDSRFTTKISAPASLPTSETASAARPRRVAPQVEPIVLKPANRAGSQAFEQPLLSGVSLGTSASVPGVPRSSPVEVGPGDVVRIDTNLVTVPVSVMDRQGRFIANLQPENFKVFDNGVEQRVDIFEPTEKPFTVALLLDTSGSTVFHLSEIKEAAISFAKQLRPQDRVLVVTFNDEVLLLTEATNDLNVVTQVINYHARTGYATRLYDALELVINERLNRIKGRKAIVLFTDGVDTASYQASYQSTLREAEELDALIYPIQYDTTDFIAATQGSNVTVVTTRSNYPFPGRSTSRVISGPALPGPSHGSTVSEYRRADEYLNQLSKKSGARLFQANDKNQLADAFAKIAEELRCQYTLGYYPLTAPQVGERRLINVRVDQADLAVRARDSYVQAGPNR